MKNNTVATQKYLIQLSSANFGNKKVWSMSADQVLNVTEITKKYENRTNAELSKFFSGITDTFKFRKDYDGFISDLPQRTQNGLVSRWEKMIKSYHWKFDANNSEHVYQRQLNQKLNFLDQFKSLSVERKEAFTQKLREFGFLIIRNSYIYLVVDANEVKTTIDDIESLFKSI
jgi:hypothetical protein